MKLPYSRMLAAILVIVSVVAAASGCTTAAPAAASVEPTQAPATQTNAPATPAPATAAPSPTAAPTSQPTDAPPKDYGQIGADLMKSESLGDVKLGMTESEILAKAGQPDSESDAQVWGADGMKHSDWTYKDKGLTVNMTETSNPESEFVVYSITADATCGLATQKGVKVGDGKDAVMAAYGDAVDPTTATDDRIVAGTEFGGVIFTMKDGKVTGIFIGASAE